FMVPMRVKLFTVATFHEPRFHFLLINGPFRINGRRNQKILPVNSERPLIGDLVHGSNAGSILDEEAFHEPALARRAPTGGRVPLGAGACHTPKTLTESFTQKPTKINREWTRMGAKKRRGARDALPRPGGTRPPVGARRAAAPRRRSQ